jgi:iron complex outermembrane recepter protein
LPQFSVFKCFIQMKTGQFFLFVFALFAFSAQAQHTVRGRITNSDGEPLFNATIALKSSHLGTTSALDGSYVLRNLTNGKNIIRVSYVGHEALEKEVDFELFQKEIELNFELKFSPFQSAAFVVEATRASDKTPMTVQNIGKEEIESRNLGQDLPFLLDMSTAVVSTSDAGAGVGYTNMRIRGSDMTATNVTVNGIPLNDAESHGVFLVNMPDFASSVNSIQIQRGVGTSTNGAGAFGATVNMSTLEVNEEAYGSYSGGVGSFNTQRHSVQFGSGLIDKKFTFDGRLSQITSDGYIDRAQSTLQSYYFSAGYHGKKSMLKFVTFNGFERTYQAWNGVPRDMLSTNRTYNAYTYPNEVDNYNQNHYQLHFKQEISKHVRFTTALHYTKGRGYFEQYKGSEYNPDLEFGSRARLSSYGLPNVLLSVDTLGISDTLNRTLPDYASTRTDTLWNESDSSLSRVVHTNEITRSNIIRRRWLDNDFYGAIFNLNITKGKWDINFGGGLNKYEGAHFGEVIWAEFASTSQIYDRYYDNFGTKTDMNSYLKASYQITNKLNLFADMQVRRVHYKVDGSNNDGRNLAIDDEMIFFNPKGGFFYELTSKEAIYASAAVANREPNRRDYTDANVGVDPVHETLIDYELGYRRRTRNYSFSVNAYYMDYQNQLVQTGQVNDVGTPIRMNIDRSYRAGLETELAWNIYKNLQWGVNASFSENKILRWTEKVDDWDTWEQVAVEHENTTIAFSPSLVAGSVLQYRFNHVFMKRDDRNDFATIAFYTKYVGEQFIDNTQSSDRILEAYLTNDLRLEYGLKGFGAKEISINFLVRNLFNNLYESNAWVYRYREGGQFRDLNGFFPQAGTHFLLGLNVRF